MLSTKRPFGLLAPACAAMIVTSLVLACTAPVDSMSGDSNDTKSGKKKSGSNGDDDDDNGGGKTTTTGLPCAVSQALSKNCQTCHGAKPATGASTSLVTFDDLQKTFNGKKVGDLVKTRVHADSGRMPPAARLSDAEMKAIDDWVAGGEQRSDDSCNVGNGPPPATQPFVCPAPGKTTVIKGTKPFTWTDNSKPDQYVCFGFDEQAGSKKHAIAMGPMVQNLGIVHHLLLFQADETVSSEPFACDAFGSGKWKLVTGWAPGGGNYELPPEAGFPVAGTTHWVLQIHYNNAKNAANQSDNSGYQLCETDQLRPNDAGVLAFGSMDFTIPPRTAAYTMRCDYKLDDRYQGVKFFAGTPHMHTHGVSISTERLAGGNGSPEVIISQNPFSFENQEATKLGAKAVNPGDVMRTRCTWKNTGDTPIKFGEGTADEMCFNFLSYYPAIPDRSLGPIPIQTWVSPSLSLPLLGGPDCAQE